MKIYKVLYFPKTGRNIIISYSKSNYKEWGFEKPHRVGCCTSWNIHLGKMHIRSQKPNNPTES